MVSKVKLCNEICLRQMKSLRDEILLRKMKFELRSNGGRTNALLEKGYASLVGADIIRPQKMLGLMPSSNRLSD